MRRVTLVLAGFIFTLAFAGLASAGPQLTMSQENFNFGYSPQNSRLTHVFWLHSTGDEALQIQQVVPGCGCTKAPLEKDVIEPGDSARLEIIFSSGRYKNHIIKKPKIVTNEVEPEHRVQIESDIMDRPDTLSPLVLRPYKLDISQFGDKVRDKMKFDIKNVSDQPVKLRLVDVPGDVAEVELPETIAPGETGKGILKLNDKGLDTTFEKSFTIEVEGNPSLRYTVPVKRAIMEELSSNSK